MSSTSLLKKKKMSEKEKCSQQCYPFEELSAIFIKFEIVVCKLFQSLKFVVWCDRLSFKRIRKLMYEKGENLVRKGENAGC